MKYSWHILTEEEMAAADAACRRHALDMAWRAWEVASCEERGGHWWWLELHPDEGIYLGCLHCPADVDDVYPDGHELMYGEFEVFPGYTLSVSFASVLVNGRDLGGFSYGWRGPVTVDLRIETYRSYVGPTEYDVWVDLEAA
jgi:hypothetical protein